MMLTEAPAKSRHYPIAQRIEHRKLAELACFRKESSEVSVVALWQLLFQRKELEILTELKVHPAADIFPLMSDEELADMAESIKANGLRYAIVIDANGQLIDGRNRLAACKLAGVEPRFENLNGHDPLAYIADANLKRRNLTKGQQAMALAMIYPETGERGRGKKSQALKSAETAGFSSRRLNEARSVLAFSRPAAEAVVKGVDSLDEALTKMRAQVAQASSKEALLQELRDTAPHLRDLVDEGRMSLNEAIGAMREEDRQARIAREGGRKYAEEFLHLSEGVACIASAIQSGEPGLITDDLLASFENALTNLRKLREVQR
jgi:hypothetical protein